MPTGRALMMTLTGPTPAPFTGDRATAQQFLDEFNQLVRANLRHLLVSRPELRVELALQYIDKTPVTTAWRRSARSQSRDSGLTDETVWDRFYDSFCTAWTDDLAAPITTIPPTRPAPGSDGVIDLANSDLAEWALPAPRAEMTQTPPRPPRSPRRVSPTASLLDSVKPVDEPPRPTRTPAHPTPVPSVSASATSRAEGPQTDDDDDATISNDEDGSYEGSTPLLPPPALAAFPAVPASVVEDDNSPERGVKTLVASVFALASTFPHPVSSVLPPQTPIYNSYDSPCRVLFAPIPRKRPREPDNTTDRDHTRRARQHLEHPPDSRLMKTARRIVATKHRNQHAWHQPRDHAPDTIRRSRVRHALTDEEQRRYLTEGRTESYAPSYRSATLTSVRTNTEAQPRSPRYADIFPRHAFEMPRDPDEVAPAARQSQKRATAAPSTTDPAPRPTSSLHATTPVFTPRLPHAGPTQIHDVRCALQRRTPTIDHHLVRATTRIRDEQIYAAPPAMTRSCAENAHVRPRRHSRDQPTQTHGSRLALQQPASYLARALTRVPQNIIRTDATRPSLQTQQPRGDAADPNQPSTAAAARIRNSSRHHHTNAAVTAPRPNANAENTSNRDRQPHSSRSVPQPTAAPVDVQPTRNRERPGTIAVNSASIHAWLTQIIYEPLPSPYWYRAHHDYEYDNYHATRHEH
ncbi:hypothetical protein EDB85DRAFT_1887616 [Lactarius pseudohatsudake]|nr:hypothetical protein EDB85DRAFT_1887616 [Lactarius pseudohatsudake]